MSKMSSEAGADEPATEVFTAIAILNREGHAPGAAGGSAQSQHRRGVDPGGEPDERGAVRRGAIAGGAVLAGGAALGVAIFADSEPTAGETALAAGDGGEDAYPGKGLLDPEVFTEAPPAPAVIDPAAGTGALDDAAHVVSPGAVAGIPTGADHAHPEAAPADPGGHDAAPGGSGGGGDDTAFGSGSGRDTSGSDSSDSNPSGDDTGGGDEGGPLGVGSDEGVLDTGLLASDSESSGDESESSGDSDGGDDGDGGLLDTGLLG